MATVDINFRSHKKNKINDILEPGDKTIYNIVIFLSGYKTSRDINSVNL